MNKTRRDNILLAMNHMTQALALMEEVLEEEVLVYEHTRKKALSIIHTSCEQNIDLLCRACLDLSNSIDFVDGILDTSSKAA